MASTLAEKAAAQEKSFELYQADSVPHRVREHSRMGTRMAEQLFVLVSSDTTSTTCKLDPKPTTIPNIMLGCRPPPAVLSPSPATLDRLL